MSDWNKTIQEMFASPELDKAERVDCYEQAVCDLAKATEEQRAEITRLSSELAASHERERALERECEASMVTIAEERCRAEAAEAKAKRLRLATIEECIALVDAFKDSEDVSALAAVAESKGVMSPGWIKDAMHSHAGELAEKIVAALRALSEQETSA